MAATENDPLSELVSWYEEATDKRSGVVDACAMSLATASLDAKPSLRCVRVQQLDKNGVVFYTNRYSQKVEQLSKNNRVAGLFYWGALYKQVRLEGTLRELPRSDVEAHFSKVKARALQYNIIAFASNDVYDTREAMENRWKAVAQRYETGVGDSPSCPEHFLGFCLVPDMVELYQSDTDSGMYIHSRRRYYKSDDGWSMKLLAP